MYRDRSFHSGVFKEVKELTDNDIKITQILVSFHVLLLPCHLVSLRLGLLRDIFYEYRFQDSVGVCREVSALVVDICQL